MKKALSFALILLLAPILFAQDWSAPPTFGEAEIASGFVDDPYTVDVIAGGPVSLEGIGYYGYVAEAPDFDLYYEAGEFPLTIRVQSRADTLLLVSDPSGSWHFSDDELGLNPIVSFDEPESGLYNVWVGVLSEGETPEAEMIITELE